MALHALGSVSVAADGTVTKSGECEVVYDLLHADAAAAASDAHATLPVGSESVGYKTALARMATTIATYVHAALTTRAQAKITTSDAGIQRMPASTVENTECKAPSTDKFISIV